MTTPSGRIINEPEEREREFMPAAKGSARTPIGPIVDNCVLEVNINLDICLIWQAGLTENKTKPSSWGFAKLGNYLSRVGGGGCAGYVVGGWINWK